MTVSQLPAAQSSALPEVMLKIDEAAGKLKVGRTKVIELMNAGILRSVKIGGSRRIRMSDFMDYVDSLEPSVPARTRREPAA